MASTIFDVTPEELETSASKVEGKTSEFTKAYNSIYTAVSDLRVTYKGEASDTFNQRIEGYKNDFSAAEKASIHQNEGCRFSGSPFLLSQCGKDAIIKCLHLMILIPGG